MNGVIPLGPLQLALAAGLILVNGLLSVWLGLNLEKRLFIASLRTIIQLTLMGFILAPVFRWGEPTLILTVGLMMILLAARESVRRTGRTWSGIHLATTVALFLGPGLTAIFATTAVVQPNPWWKPQYFIPLLGMLLGNTLNGISLGLDYCLRALDEGYETVEYRLSMGATWWQASRVVASQALRTGMLPIINTMSVVGMVTIPGMMTGQILGGTSPQMAARYQIMIMFLIASATAIGTAIAVLISIRANFDNQHRLRRERISRRG